MASQVQINLNYGASVQNALQAGNQILAQVNALSAAEQQTILRAAQLNSAIQNLSRTAANGIGAATKATTQWANELARVGVFMNKTLASMAASLQSFGTNIKSVFANVGGGAGGVLGGTTSFLNEFSRSVSDFIGTGGFIQQIGKATAVGAQGLIKVGTQIGSFIIQGVGQAASKLPKLLGELIQIGGNVSGLIAGIGGTLFKAGGISVGLFVSGVANAAGAVTKAFGSIFEGITSLAVTTFTGLGNVIGASIGGAIEIVSSVADRIGAVLGDIGSKIGDILGKAVAGGLAVAIPIAFKSAEFRDGLSASFGVVVDELDRGGFNQLVDGAKKVAVDVGLALGDLPQALFKQISPGFKGTVQTLEDFRGAAKLAAIGNVDLSDAIDAVNIALAAYGNQIGSADDVARKLFNATRDGRLEVRDLTDELGFVVGAAKGAALGFDELLTAINLSQRILPASTAVKGIANAIKSLQAPAKEAQAEFADFFDAIQRGDGTLQSLRDILVEVRKRGLEVDPQAFRKLFPDERGARAIRALLLQTRDGFELYDKILKQTADDTGAFEKVSDVALNTISRRFVAFGAQIVSVGDTFLEKFRGPIVDTINAAIKVVAQFEDQIRKIDPAFVIKLTESVVDFIGSVPQRIKGALDIFESLKTSISKAVSAAKEFLDINLNITQTFKELLAGNFGDAFDLFFGSKAISRVSNFFTQIKAEAAAAINSITGIGQVVGKSVQNVVGTVVNNSFALKAAKLVTPNSLTSGKTNPLEFAAQTAFGVNPIQTTANVGASTVGGAAIGAGAAAGAGALFGASLGPVGIAAGALVGALVGWFKSTSEAESIQKVINESLRSIEDTAKKQYQEFQKRQAASEEGTAALNSASVRINKANEIEAKIRESIRDSILQREPREKRISELAASIDATNQEIAGIQFAGYEDLVSYAEAVGRSRASEEIIAKEAERSREVSERTTQVREALLERLSEQQKITAEITADLKAIKDPPKTFISRGIGPFDVTGAPIAGGLFGGSSRDTSLIGGGAESALIKALDDLTNAIESSTKAQEALKIALKPENLNPDTPGLNTRARHAIRKARRDRERATADEINARFSSTAPDVFGPLSTDSSIFGFGGSPGSAGSFLRKAAFGDGFGFGTGLPGEKDRFGSTGLKDLIEQLNKLSTGTLPRVTDSGVVDVGELLTGAPSPSARVRGRKSPFSGAGDDVISALKDLVRTLADRSGIFGGRDSGEELKRLTADAAESLGKDATQIEILTKVKESLQALVDSDKEAKERAKESKEVIKKEEALKESLAKEEKLKASAASAGSIASAEVPPVDAKAITDKFVSEEKAKADAKLAELQANTEELSRLRDEIENIDANTLTQITALQDELSIVMSDGVSVMQDLASTSLDIFNRFNDIGNEFVTAASTLQDKFKEVSNQQTQLAKDVDELRRRVQGK